STNVPAGTDNGGGGIYVFSNASLANATLAGNSASATAGGGVFNNGSTLQSADSIIAQNTSGSGGGNCAGTGTQSFQSLGYNLEDDSDKTCNFVGTGDIINSNPGLGSLQDNGGPTLTRRLLAGSPAIDAGNPSGCLDTFGSLLTTDQRGAPRVGRCDIGAYEASPPVNT